LCTDDVIFDDAGVDRAIRGRDALIEFLGSIYGLAVDVEVQILDRYISLDGASAAAHWVATGTLREPLGQPARLETAELYEFRDGLISRWTFIVRELDWLGRQWGA
jgi:hypothetical protein